jgi:hypothetical protein
MNSNLFPPCSPCMAHERQGCGFQGLDRDHDEAPADGVEDAPGGSVVGSHGHYAAYKSEIESVPDR